MANPLLASSLNLANHTGGAWSKNIKGGILGQLVSGEPQLKIGKTDHFTFTGTPKAELVGEGQNKSSEDGQPPKKTVSTYKVQITYRYSDELMISDEEYQTGIIDGLVANTATAISRALDLVAIHGINPKTGLIASSVTEYFDRAGNGVGRVIATANSENDIEELAKDLQGAGYSATGIAFDPVYAGELARVKDLNGNQKYPELGLGFNVTNFRGLPAASGDTVSGRQELEASEVSVQGIMGDWEAFKWGVARDMPLELIQYGDPDGLGDLKRTNEVAIRAEAIFGYAILDPAAFSIVSRLAASS